MSRFAFVGGIVWTAAGPPLEGATVLVEDGKVVAVGADVDTAGAEIVDCSGGFVLPGLVDAHTHTGVWGEGASDDYDGNEISEAITAYTRALDSIYPEDVGFEDARRGGVTTLGVMHGSANPIGGQLAVVKAAGLVADDMVVKAPAGVKMALGENPKRVGDLVSRAPRTRMGAAYLARKAFVEAIEYRIDREHFAARKAAEEMKPESERAPLREPERDLGKEILLMVLDGEIPVRNHAHRMDDIRTAIRLAEEFGYRLIIDHATEAWRIPHEIVSRGIPVAVGPLFSERSKRELNHLTPASPGVLVAAGAEVSIMTDSPFCPVQHLRDQVIFAIREGLDPERALETVTINPARILGVEDRVGSLEPGKDADIIVLDGDPWDARSVVTQTWVDGRRVYERTGPYLPNWTG